MTARRLLPLLLLPVACSGAGDPGAVEPPDQTALEAACAAVDGAIEAGEIPGAVLLVGRGEEVLLRRAFGLRAAEPVAEPMSADTLFDLASLTKVVATATSVMRLVQQGRVQLSDPVARHLPDFAASGKQGITVEELLLHRGGLVADNPLEDYALGAEEAWRRILASEPASPPGERFVYSDVGYIVLGRLVEAVDGRSLDRFAREEVFEPLGMHATRFLPDPEQVDVCAPSERDVQGAWLRGVVHDPRARALGGVAGHAGLFSTADDLARWCRAILAGGAGVLESASVAEMTRPRWLPDGSGGRSLGFDVDTRYSSARGSVFARGASFGHTGFTGTSLWLDPESDSFVILLTSRLHPDGKGSVVPLRAAVATAVGRALAPAAAPAAVATGADVLAEEGCARLAGRRVALLTNVTGRTRAGERTVDVIARAEGVELAAIFTPEHGFHARDEGEIPSGTDPATGVPVVSLYAEARRPDPARLAGLDLLVVDLQDVGTRFYTYATSMGYAMEVAGECGVAVMVLDRPNPITGTRVWGPCADPERLSFITYRPIPVVHGLTIGELARLYVEHFGLRCELEVVPCRGWRRAMWWDETGLTWIDPSPNLRAPEQALLYPAVGLLEGSNLSVGRGTDEPFERFGAPWIDGLALARVLNDVPLAGMRCTPIEFTPRAEPHAGVLCGGVHLSVLDREAVRPVEAGLAIAWHLNRLHGREFEVAEVGARLVNHEAWSALMTSDDPGALSEGWAEELEEFRKARERVLLYD